MGRCQPIRIRGDFPCVCRSTAVFALLLAGLGLTAAIAAAAPPEDKAKSKPMPPAKSGKLDPAQSRKRRPLFLARSNPNQFRFRRRRSRSCRHCPKWSPSQLPRAAQGGAEVAWTAQSGAQAAAAAPKVDPKLPVPPIVTAAVDPPNPCRPRSTPKLPTLPPETKVTPKLPTLPPETKLPTKVEPRPILVQEKPKTGDVVKPKGPGLKLPPGTKVDQDELAKIKPPVDLTKTKPEKVLAGKPPTDFKVKPIKLDQIQVPKDAATVNQLNVTNVTNVTNNQTFVVNKNYYTGGNYHTKFGTKTAAGFYCYPGKHHSHWHHCIWDPCFKSHYFFCPSASLLLLLVRRRLLLLPVPLVRGLRDLLLPVVDLRRLRRLRLCWYAAPVDLHRLVVVGPQRTDFEVVQRSSRRLER